MSLKGKLNFSCSGDMDLWNEQEQILRICTIGLITLLIVVSNIINMAILPSITQLQTTSRIFFTNMSVADLLVGCFLGIPAFVTAISDDRWVFGKTFCSISAAIHSSSAGVSMMSLTCISILRYISVLHPLKYRFVTKKICFAVLAVTWMYCVFIFLLPLIFNGGIYDCTKVYSYCIGIYLNPRLIMVTVLALPIPGLLVVICTTIRVAVVLRRYRTPGEGQAREKKSIKLLAVSAACFYLAYVPFIIVWGLMTFRPELRVKMPLLIGFFAIWMSNTNSFLNVVVYMAMYREFRAKICRALRALFCRRRSRRRNEDIRSPVTVSSSVSLVTLNRIEAAA